MIHGELISPNIPVITCRDEYGLVIPEFQIRRGKNAFSLTHNTVFDYEPLLDPIYPSTLAIGAYTKTEGMILQRMAEADPRINELKILIGQRYMEIPWDRLSCYYNLISEQSDVGLVEDIYNFLGESVRAIDNMARVGIYECWHDAVERINQAIAQSPLLEDEQRKYRYITHETTHAVNMNSFGRRPALLRLVPQNPHRNWSRLVSLLHTIDESEAIGRGSFNQTANRFCLVDGTGSFVHDELIARLGTLLSELTFYFRTRDRFFMFEDIPPYSYLADCTYNSFCQFTPVDFDDIQLPESHNSATLLLLFGNELRQAATSVGHTFPSLGQLTWTREQDRVETIRSVVQRIVAVLENRNFAAENINNALAVLPSFFANTVHQIDDEIEAFMAKPEQPDAYEILYYSEYLRIKNGNVHKQSGLKTQRHSPFATGINKLKSLLSRHEGSETRS